MPNQPYAVVPAQEEHIPRLAARMRPQDRLEVAASHGQSPETALRESLARSPLAWCCLLGGNPAFMWGVAGHGAPHLPHVGLPWLLASLEIDRLKAPFLRQCGSYVKRMQSRFPCLVNFVHAENAASVRWLRWCGFTVQDKITFINGAPFRLFWKIFSEGGQ